MLAVVLGLLGCVFDGAPDPDQTLCSAFCECSLFSPTLVEQCTADCVDEGSLAGASEECAECVSEYSCDLLEQGVCSDRCTAVSN